MVLIRAFYIGCCFWKCFILRLAFSRIHFNGLISNGGNRGCACLGGEVDLPPGVVEEEEAALVVLVRRYRRAFGAAVRRAVDDEVWGAVKKETGPAAVRCVPPSLLGELSVNECPWCAWNRRCIMRCGSAPGRGR